METTPVRALPRRLIDLVFSPGKLFEYLAANPVWLGALLVGAAVAALGTFLVPSELFEATMRRQILDSGGQMPGNMEQAARIGKIAAGVGALIVGPLFTAAVAGLVAFIFAFVLGDEGTYRQHLAALAHAFVIPSLSSLILLPLRISAQDMQLRLSIGTFLPFLEDGWFATALSWLDLFGLWAWVLVGLAASKIDPKRSWFSASAILLTIVVILTFAFAAIFAR